MTLGHPCCSVPHCFNELASQRDRFCPAHAGNLKICAVVRCEEPVVEGRRVCANPSHLSAEALYNLRKTSRFQLVNRLERTRFAHARQGGASTIIIDPAEAADEDEDEPGGVADEAYAEEDFELDEEGNAVVSSLL